MEVFNLFFANLRMMMSVDASCTMRCQSLMVERGWGSTSQDAEDGRGSHDPVLDQSELGLVLVGAEKLKGLALLTLLL